MPGAPDISGSDVPALDDLLLDAKLSLPLARKESVSRTDLIRTATASGRPIVAVVAPAGYGKTTLLTAWAAAESRSVGWVSLDRFDDDPVALLTLLAAAFVRATGADPGIIADMRVPSVATLGRAAPRLSSALRATSRPFVLFVDDLHLVGPASSDVLEVVLRGVPSGSQFVAASRTAQPHVASLRARGDVLEFGLEDLALDAEGARQIFREERIDLTADLARAAAVRTEGWPVGMKLAAMIARDTRDPSRVIVGDDRFVADYLYRESFSTLPEATRQFLRRTAVLEHLSDDLCRHVTGDATAPILLRELESANVFLIPEDRTRKWYRYHPLYREFLLDELRRTDPTAMPELHELAASWYEANDSPANAIEHLLQGEDEKRCVVMVTALGLITYQAGEQNTLQRWIASVGDRAVMAHPPLAVLTAWMSVLSGRPLEAERWRSALESMTFDEPPGDGAASFESSRAMLLAAMCASGPAQMLADAHAAVEAEPGWSPWRDFALSMLGEAYLVSGDVQGAAEYYARASDRAAAVGNSDVRTRTDTQRALIHMDAGRWHEAAALLDGALAAVRDHRLADYASAVLTFAAAARMAVHRGDVKEAHRELTRAMRARPVCTWAMPTVAVRSSLCLAKTYWALGDHSTARHLVREIDDLLTYRPHMGVFVTQQSDLKALVTAPGSAGFDGPPLTPAELRLLPYLQTHLTIPEISTRLFLSRNTVSTEVGSIYRKLGASSRSEAVDRAVAVGLLGA
ncbi:AAA family ATPase [Microbacterium lacus]|uniref:AAA family ATPase n=1 Tax=Microbacterium lacus TaxID=415217 RepID=UPI00384ACFCF